MLARGPSQTGRSGVPSCWSVPSHEWAVWQPYRGTLNAAYRSAARSRRHVPPLWREWRFGLEAAALLRSRRLARRGRARPATGAAGAADPRLHGRRRLAGDDDAVAAGAGYRTQRAGIRANVGCSEDACARLEERLEALAERTGAARRDHRPEPRRRVRPGARRAAARPRVAGSSRSARRCVSQLARPPARARRRSASSARWARGRVPALFSLRCLRGECCERFRGDARGPVPARRRLRRALLALRRHRRLARLPGPGARPSSSRSAPRTAAWPSTRAPTARSPARSARSPARGRAAARR